MPWNPVVSRRTAVGGAAAAVAAMLAGCTSPDSRPKATRTAPARHSPAADPDVRIAAEVLVHERLLLERVTATIGRHPKLAAPLASTRAAHRAHVALLTKAVPNDTPVRAPSRRVKSARVPLRAAPALAALAAAERRQGDVAAHSSLVARSGPFARVLASMAAASSQQSVRLAAAAAERA